MQRMWTYEEAVLSANLVFVLKDDRFHTFSHTTVPSMIRTVSVVWRTLAAQLYRLRANKDRLNIGHVYRAFRCWRLANAKSEEFQSVAGMLGLTTTELIPKSGNTRTREFWKMLRILPLDIPLLEGPKLRTKGFRWAPATMMFPNKSEISTDTADHQGICTEDSLSGTYLLVPLDRALCGCSRRSQSIFHVHIEQSENINQIQRGSTILRVYCLESWPEFPDSAPFDGLILGNAVRTIPSVGACFPAAALLRDSDAGGSTQDFM